MPEKLKLTNDTGSPPTLEGVKGAVVTSEFIGFSKNPRMILS